MRKLVKIFPFLVWLRLTTIETIKADFIGKNIPTHEGEHIKVLLKEIDDKDSVLLTQSRD